MILRREAVLHYHTEVERGVGKELALTYTVEDFAKIRFRFNRSTLRKWIEHYKTFGIDGLVEQKAGVVGRKRKNA